MNRYPHRNRHAHQTRISTTKQWVDVAEGLSRNDSGGCTTDTFQNIRTALDYLVVALPARTPSGWKIWTHVEKRWPSHVKAAQVSVRIAAISEKVGWGAYKRGRRQSSVASPYEGHDPSN